MDPVKSLDVVTNTAQRVCLSCVLTHWCCEAVTSCLEILQKSYKTKISTLWDSGGSNVPWPDMPHARKCRLIFKEAAQVRQASHPETGVHWPRFDLYLPSICGLLV